MEAQLDEIIAGLERMRPVVRRVDQENAEKAIKTENPETPKNPETVPLPIPGYLNKIPDNTFYTQFEQSLKDAAKESQAEEVRNLSSAEIANDVDEALKEYVVPGTAPGTEPKTKSE